MITLNKKILLGSGSPRRQILLKELGVNFRLFKSNTDEIPLPHLLRGDIASYLAEEKANALQGNIHDNEILVTADTIVCIGDQMLGKPADTNEAFDMLTKLNGKQHQVYTAVCIQDQKKRKTICVETDVTFKKLNDDELLEYIDLYKPFDKAGAYGAQECLPIGINPCSEKEKEFLKKYSIENLYERTLSTENKKRIPLIDHIDGSYFNVMGLPIVELIEELLVVSS